MQLGHTTTRTHGLAANLNVEKHFVRNGEVAAVVLGGAGGAGAEEEHANAQQRDGRDRRPLSHLLLALAEAGGSQCVLWGTGEWRTPAR